LAREIRAESDFVQLRLILTTSGNLGIDQRLSSERLFNAVLVNPALPDGLIRALSSRSASWPAPQKIGTVAPAASIQGAIGPKIRVLVAEDNQTNQIVIRGLLEKAGVRVDLVGNGLEAVAAVRERPYDLVLMDVMMPELDGVAATRQIRESPGKESRVPIIGLTANVSEEDHATFKAAGMDMILTKPIRYQQLKELLSDGRWTAGRQVAESE
jgi:CheY-like chemotaxis protein